MHAVAAPRGRRRCQDRAAQRAGKPPPDLLPVSLPASCIRIILGHDGHSARVCIRVIAIQFVQRKLDLLRVQYDDKHCGVHEKAEAFEKAESERNEFDQAHHAAYTQAVNDMVAWVGREAGPHGSPAAVPERQTACEAQLALNQPSEPLSIECAELKRKVRALRAGTYGGGGCDWWCWL